MRKLFTQAKSLAKEHLDAPKASSSAPPPPTSDHPSTIAPPTIRDLYRYRYHHGTNLGSIFCLERWLTPSMYPDPCHGSSELSAVSASLSQSGPDATRDKFSRHWNEYVSDADLDWLANEGGCTSVRLPIGYWTLGPDFCKGTAFEKVAGTYEGAWAAFRALVRRCGERGIGVLVDLHGLPGGANPNDHSGTDSGKAEFWERKGNVELGVRCVEFVVGELRGEENLVGVQVVNEAEWGAKGMWEFYDRAREAVGKVDGGLPVYVSDAWDLGKAAGEVGSRNAIGARGPPLVLDTHLYWCFSDQDKAKTARQIAGEVYNKLGELDSASGSVVDKGACQAVVGEYSCVLTEDSWQKSGHEGSKEDLAREFGRAQSRRYQDKAGGSFFWTYRMDWMDGGEWGFKEQTNKGSITAPVNVHLDKGEVEDRVRRAREARDGKRGATWGSHCQYWDTTYPGQYEHHRFEAGWNIGFEDALSIFEMRTKSGRGRGGDKIGMLDLWVLKRLKESGQGGKFVWEYEQGLRQGIRDFYELAGV
ncbi:cellulase-like protein 8 [Elsinoe australis]|uniref:Cellulase-like protein 8 n=1 Tax=Elsinoe australis TaxID=40998 RepID=A0A4U7AMC6_9PEZI|nr:cellulase-like protein 8 [Elsinoe australis]